MKNTVRFSLLSFLAAFLLFQGSLFAQDSDESLGAALPPFQFEGLDGQMVTPASFPSDQPIIVIYFDPWCDHCQTQAGWINDAIDQFKGISILWVSFGVMDDTKPFPAKYFPGVEKKDMIFGVDSKFMMDSYFGYSEVPSIYVYNKEQVRVKAFRHETEIDKLLNFAK